MIMVSKKSLIASLLLIAGATYIQASYNNVITNTCPFAVHIWLYTTGGGPTTDREIPQYDPQNPGQNVISINTGGWCAWSLHAVAAQSPIQTKDGYIILDATDIKAEFPNSACQGHGFTIGISPLTQGQQQLPSQVPGQGQFPYSGYGQPYYPQQPQYQQNQQNYYHGISQWHFYINQG